MILISNDFWHEIKMYNFDPYNVLSYIATNIPVLLMTAFVLQGHIYIYTSLFDPLTVAHSILILYYSKKTCPF